jgi:hypothetical protein
MLCPPECQSILDSLVCTWFLSLINFFKRKNIKSDQSSGCWPGIEYKIFGYSEIPDLESLWKDKKKCSFVMFILDFMSMTKGVNKLNGAF